MNADPDGNYFQPSLGSLTGFDQINFPVGTPSLVQQGWSIDELQRFLLNVDGVNFPTEDWIRKVDELITLHINDFNNPHHVTLDQIIGDFTRDVLANITPGTPPTIAPFFAYDATCPLPLNDIYPASYTYTNLYSMTDGGVLRDVTQDTELLGVDCGIGRPSLPLFPSFTNSTPSNWVSLPSTPNSTVLSSAFLPNISYPFTFYAVAEVGNASGPYGVNIPCSTAVSSVYTTTFFILPTTVGGSLLIYQRDDSDNTITIDLSNGSVTASSDDINAVVYTYVSGVIRVSINFTAVITSANNLLTVVHLNPGDTSPNRTGQANRRIFSIGYPLTAMVGLNHPIILDQTKPANTSTMALALSAAGVPATMSQLTLTLTLDVYPDLTPNTATYEPVFTFGSLQITRDATNFYVSVGNGKLFTSAILEGLNILSLSYTGSQIDFKDLASSRQTNTGFFSPLSTGNVLFGRFGGYVRSFAFYAQRDPNQSLEYLTNG